MSRRSDAAPLAAAPAGAEPRRDRGRRACLTGAEGERAVARAYARRGAALLATRWRGAGGEIDLVVLLAGVHIFCEVKTARSFDAAAARLQPAQMRRVHAAAAEFLAQAPDGQLSEVRFDLAVVDRHGRVEIAENAFGHF